MNDNIPCWAGGGAPGAAVVPRAETRAERHRRIAAAVAQTEAIEKVAAEAGVPVADVLEYLARRRFSKARR